MTPSLGNSCGGN